MIKDAFISPCGTYRYQLYRKWEESERLPILWVMLNPSTADHNIDDPTIRRCVSFSKAWGYGSMYVGNAFAFRATDPTRLDGLTVAEAAGPDNHTHLWNMASRCARTVVAWGARGPHFVAEEIKSPGGVWCLGATKDGRPKHPLYVKGDTQLLEFPLQKPTKVSQ